MPIRTIWPLKATVLHIAVPALMLYALLWLYGSAGHGVAVASALGFTAAMGTAARLYRYIPVQGAFPYIRAAYIAAAFFIALDIVLAVYVPVCRGMTEFWADLPLFGVTGVYIWVVVTGRTDSTAPEDIPAEPAEVPREPSPVPAQPFRITVKKGGSLHIIESADIIYVAAMGDYVSIVTRGGRFVKEGTMGRYEGALGEGFVRIHRSTIVSIAHISAIELYGKQSYSVRLTTGESLRASSQGYRNLRSRLG